MKGFWRFPSVAAKQTIGGELKTNEARLGHVFWKGNDSP